MKALELIMAAFDGVDRADEVWKELHSLDSNDTISILNSVVIRKDADGHVSASEDGDVRPGSGVLFGALAGAIIGLLGGPAGAVVGAAAGAITGGVTAAGIDLGFSNDVIREMQNSLQPDSSAILALVEGEWVEAISTELSSRHGRIIHQAVREEFAERFRSENKTE